MYIYVFVKLKRKTDATLGTFVSFDGLSITQK